jgi:hypothetical protein
MEDKLVSQDSQDLYATGKYSKVGDFFIGFGIAYGIGVVVSLVWAMLASGILRFFPFGVSLFSVYIIPFALEIGGCIFIYKKYFSGRRLVKIGMIVAILLPILFIALLFGMCMIAFSGL